MCNDFYRVWTKNYRVYGVKKVWLQPNRERIPVARCTVERLMQFMGIEGASRGGKKHRTTIVDPTAPRPVGLVDRKSTVARPDSLWVAEFTYVATWAGTIYVAFVIDVYSRRIPGWRASTNKRTELVRSGPWATPTTLPWPRARLGSTRPNSSTHTALERLGGRRTDHPGTGRLAQPPTPAATSHQPNLSRSTTAHTGLG
ncbi:hypothetical protein GCM10022223_52430 [Kineosporia mesophila]|uniref:Transposase n=1 Tax=Kineosporia mesophila TaxID=566012 RepID=A0ABP7ABR3_9ACTN